MGSSVLVVSDEAAHIVVVVMACVGIGYVCAHTAVLDCIVAVVGGKAHQTASMVRFCFHRSRNCQVFNGSSTDVAEWGYTLILIARTRPATLIIDVHGQRVSASVESALEGVVGGSRSCAAHGGNGNVRSQFDQLSGIAVAIADIGAEVVPLFRGGDNQGLGEVGHHRMVACHVGQGVFCVVRDNDAVVRPVGERVARIGGRSSLQRAIIVGGNGGGTCTLPVNRHRTTRRRVSRSGNGVGRSKLLRRVGEGGFGEEITGICCN